MSWRVSVSLQNDRPLAETLALARLAEELGFAELWINENGHYRGAFVQATAIASVTSRVGIGIGVVNPFHRHPSVIRSRQFYRTGWTTICSSHRP